MMTVSELSEIVGAGQVTLTSLLESVTLKMMSEGQLDSMGFSSSVSDRMWEGYLVTGLKHIFC